MAGGLWDRVRRALRREQREIADAIEDVTRRGNEVMDEKERELDATPEERLLIAEQRAAQADDEYEALKRKIEGDRES
jgi:hypothetical protein